MFFPPNFGFKFIIRDASSLWFTGEHFPAVNLTALRFLFNDWNMFQLPSG